MISFAHPERWLSGRNAN